MERWQQIESLFQEALQHDPAERDAWLREACREDSGLRREVSSLLANHHQATDFEPWAAAAAAQLVGERASLEPGHRLGPYEILAPIGAGGMGEVYKARDTRLKRDVAIKVCAAQFSERFEREARAIAALNHPNICQLYDIGPNFLVMELVEGENLSGPLAVETALDYARQIAEALEAAHEKGIVHRDLKPANVKITPAGVVKVLDFGLAKAAEEPAGRDSSISPTMTMSPTRGGMILGTAPYMAPEQVRAASVDKRADIWAFGCVLYEMLSGEQTFHGETASDILAAVLKEEPDWSRIPARTRLLLRRCLTKDRKHRLRDIGDAMPLLEDAPDVPPPRSPVWPWVVAAAFAIAFCIAGLGWWRATRAEPLRPLVQLSAELSPDTTVNRFRGGDQLAISPDGTRIGVAVRDLEGGKYHLVTRRLDQSEFAPLSGTEGANMPFFSPDGQWIAFFADGKLKKVSIQGGAPLTLCDAPNIRGGGSWGDDGNIIAALNEAEGILSRISSSGGAPTPATELDKRNGERFQSSPQVLPGSQAVLFTSNGRSGQAGIDVQSFKTGKRRTLHRGGVFGRYLGTSNGSGYLVYMQEGTLFAAPFDLNSLAVTGAPQPVLEDVGEAGLGPAWNFDLSRTGTFVYVSWKGQFAWSIFWLTSAGNAQPLQLTQGRCGNPRFSPDGKRLVFGMETGPLRTDLWVKDLERDTTSRLTSLPGRNNLPVWTSDAKHIVFEAFGSAAPGMYWIRADGSGEPQRLTDGRPRQIPSSFSANGRRLAYFQSTDGGGSEILTAAIEGDADHPRLGNPELFLRAPYSAFAPAFSPNGRWLAYYSNETGTFEVYVRPFPGPGSRFQISAGGGQYPKWAPNGRELFFLAPDRHIMVASYTTRGDFFAAGKPHVWSEKRLVEGPSFQYDPAPDGKRVAGILYSDGTSEPKPSTHLTVLQNFSDELRRRVPAGGK